MQPVPDVIKRRLFPGERVIWFGKPRGFRALLHLAPLIAAAMVWFGFFYFAGRHLIFSLALPAFVTYPLLFSAGTVYVLTDSRVIMINRIIPPRLLYLNLIDDLGAPVRIKLGWIDGIRFGERLPREEDRFKYLSGGRVRMLSFGSLEDRETVYALTLSTQRAADIVPAPAGSRRD